MYIKGIFLATLISDNIMKIKLAFDFQLFLIQLALNYILCVQLRMYAIHIQQYRKKI